MEQEKKITLTDCKALEQYRVWVQFADGIEGVVDFADCVGKEVFLPWNDSAFFGKVHISNHGSLAWNDDIEFCRDAIYLEITGLQPEDIFPKLRARLANA